MAIHLDASSEQNILNMLMDQSAISTDQMNKIKSMSKEVGKSKLETAFELNLTNENKILSLLSKAYSLDVVDLKKHVVTDKLKKIKDIKELGPKNVTNALFVGSTTELQKMIKKNKDKK